MLFKWKKGEHEAWAKKINRYNKKIEKAKKEGYEGALPDKISYKNSLSEILKNKDYTRKEFNNQIKLINIFLEKDSLDIQKSKKGAYVPKWQLKQIKEVILPDINKTNMQFKKQNEKLSGKKEKTKLNPDETRKRKLNFDYKSKNDWDMFIQTFSDFNKTVGQKVESTVEGYKKALINEMGKDGEIGYLPLQGILDNLPDEVIAANALYNENTKFTFVYSRDDYRRRFKTMHEEWKKIYNNYIKETK